MTPGGAFLFVDNSAPFSTGITETCGIDFDGWHASLDATLSVD